ncbi:hypothetical protein PV05_01897 [Exophiala xenobiotica]|uniref:Major facilitator superfamily (MFS) profile domain-containing protein n=1 Tax=Exophiala xenobiotica TaxID=348802 RepID=A0A0D2DHN4_9EURO|nr:uncharacterized protein PV05_01897 [Exophiala xenobiotica]KIW61817.1 hypothetical protein PV05_01897 [Exophiala xenobiotica]
MELQTSTSHAQSNGNAGDHSTAAIPNNGPTATAGTRTRSISRPEEPQTARSMLKLICAGFSFFYAGTNDGTIGPLLPYILRRYKVDSALATVIYVGTFAGWFLSALTNTHLTTTLRLSLGATLLLGAGLQLLAQLLRFWDAPFALFVITFFFTALGQALQDSYSNAFVATVPRAHRWLGFIHAMYMLGCLTGPLIATLVSSHTQWYYTYAVEAGLGGLNLGFVFLAFGWQGPRPQLLEVRNNDVATEARRESAGDATEVEAEAEAEAGNNNRARSNEPALANARTRHKEALKQIQQTLRLGSVWLISLFFFFFLGAAITAGGWVVEYLVRVRKGNLSSVGYIPTGYYGGGFLGRLLLAEPTNRYGERRMVFICIILCVALQVMFWTIPNIVAGGVLISALGFFSGPFFVSGISVASKLFPKSIQATALGLVFVIAQMGGSLFPTITGLIAANAGVKVLQPILVGLFVLVAASWWFVPKADGDRDQDREA